MLAFWIEIKRRLKTVWVVLAALAAGAVAVAAFALSRKKNQAAANERLDDVLGKAAEKVAVANARAAIEIHVAETKEAGVRAELQEIVRDPDIDQRSQRLIELAARVEGGKS
jgi:hypothetical protein